MVERYIEQNEVIKASGKWLRSLDEAFHEAFKELMAGIDAQGTEGLGDRLKQISERVLHSNDVARAEFQNHIDAKSFVKQ